jgi:hypothetical protein
MRLIFWITRGAAATGAVSRVVVLLSARMRLLVGEGRSEGNSGEAARAMVGAVSTLVMSLNVRGAAGFTAGAADGEVSTVVMSLNPREAVVFFAATDRAAGAATEPVSTLTMSTYWKGAVDLTVAIGAVSTLVIPVNVRVCFGAAVP